MLRTIVWLWPMLCWLLFFSFPVVTQIYTVLCFQLRRFFCVVVSLICFCSFFFFAVINLFFNKKWSLVFFLILIPGLYNFFHVVAISHPFAKWQMQKDTDAIRIMTWNVSSFVNPAPLRLP